MGEAVLSTCDPDNLRAILSTRFRDFEHGPRRRAITGIFLGAGLVNTDGEAWAHERTLAKPSFARAHEFLGTFEKHFRAWLEALPIDSGDAIDWQEWAFRYTLDVSAELFFGKPVGVLCADVKAQSRGFEAAMDIALLGIQWRFKLGKLAWLYYHPREASAIRAVQDQVDNMVCDALGSQNSQSGIQASQSGDSDNDARHHCAQFLRTLAAEGLNLKQIREQMLSIVVAGRDTSACLMSAVVFMLARRPDVQTRLRQEVQGYVGSEPPTVSRLEAMKYLSWVLKETLRLYPPLAVNVRQAARDTLLPRGGGLDGSAPVFVPKGQTVLLSTWSTHRRRDLWGEDADEFKPERWEGARPRWEYLPFSGGPRVCPGQRMAMVETGYVIVRFLQEFEHIIGVDTEVPWRENLTLTCSVAQGVQVRLIRREQAAAWR